MDKMIIILDTCINRQKINNAAPVTHVITREITYALYHEEAWKLIWDQRCSTHLSITIIR